MPDPHRHLIAAHAALANAQSYAQHAAHNLHHDQGGLPGLIAAWPTGNTPTATINPGPDPTDPCRQAQRTLEHDLHTIAATMRDLLDDPHLWPRLTHLASRLHYATRLTNLATRLTLAATPTVYQACDDTHRRAVDVRNLLAQWAYTPARPAGRHDLGVESPDWCANHARLDLGPEPVSPKAAADGHHLCDYCWSYLRGAGQRPDRDTLTRRARGERPRVLDQRAAS